MLLIYLKNEELPHCLHPSLEITPSFSLSRMAEFCIQIICEPLAEFHFPGRHCASIEEGPEVAGVHGTWRFSLFCPPPHFPRAGNDVDFRLLEVFL